ncbi:MAG: hypothetical protein ACLPTZ_06600 [Beijerinckiaceae bacterium]
MNDIELRRERRRQRALERLGSNNPRCVICGFDEPLALELHHLAGQAFGDDTVPVCRNCHRRLSDYQKDHAIGQANPLGDIEPIRRFLLGLADLCEMLVKRLRDFAAKLAALDSNADPHNGEAQS